MTRQSTEIAVTDDKTPGQPAKRNTYRGGSRCSLDPYQQLALMRELAAGDVGQNTLAKKYGMTQQGISHFLQRNALRIDDIRQNMADQFAGLPLARKENRLLAYEREVELLSEHEKHDHHLWSSARMTAYRNIAEELGQLPPRQTVTVMPVVHVIEGVDISDL